MQFSRSRCAGESGFRGEEDHWDRIRMNLGWNDGKARRRDCGSGIRARIRQGSGAIRAGGRLPSRAGGRSRRWIAARKSPARFPPRRETSGEVRRSSRARIYPRPPGARTSGTGQSTRGTRCTPRTLSGRGNIREPCGGVEVCSLCVTRWRRAFYPLTVRRDGATLVAPHGGGAGNPPTPFASRMDLFAARPQQRRSGIVRAAGRVRAACRGAGGRGRGRE